MRICHLTLEFPPSIYGGVGVHVTKLSEALVGQGVKVEVRTLQTEKEGTAGGVTIPPQGVKVRRYPKEASQSGRTNVLTALDWARKLAAERFSGDLVHGHTWYCAQPTNWLATLEDIPSVMTVHSLEPDRPWKAEQLGDDGYRLSTWMERVGLQEATHLIAVSNQTKSALQEHYQIAEDKISVIHNGIDPDQFFPGRDPAVLKRSGIKQPYCLFVGRLSRQKGIFDLLQAYENVDAEAKLVVISGAADTPELVDEMVATVKDNPRIQWIYQSMGLAELRAIYTSADLFICPSRYEPFGIINLEAMACGTAVVASNVGGIPDAVGDAGCLVDVGDGEGLTVAIETLLGDADQRQTLSEAGLARAARFTWEAIGKQTHALYAELLNR